MDNRYKMNFKEKTYHVMIMLKKIGENYDSETENKVKLLLAQNYSTLEAAREIEFGSKG